MAVTLPDAGKNTRMEKFAAFSGRASIFVISKDASPVLHDLAVRFPKALDNALFMLGGHVRRRMRRAVEEGGVGAHKWARRSYMQHSKRWVKFRAGEYPRGKGAYKGLRKYFLGQVGRTMRAIRRDAQAPRRDRFLGKVGQTIALRKKKGGVDIGALSGTAVWRLDRFQRGRTTQITRKMRLALWAARMPLGEGKTVIRQEPRPLVEPVYREMRPEFEAYLVRRTREYLDNLGLDWR